MGTAEDTQLIYIKGLLTEFDSEKIKEVEDKFKEYMDFVKQSEEHEAIGMVVLARWGFEQQIDI